MIGKKINYAKGKGRRQIQRVSLHPSQWTVCLKEKPLVSNDSGMSSKNNTERTFRLMIWQKMAEWVSKSRFRMKWLRSE